MSFNPLPRKGTETFPTLNHLDSAVNIFQSITPQGDGNIIWIAARQPFDFAFNPLPRKGTETVPELIVMRCSRLSIHYPARGRKQLILSFSSDRDSALTFNPLPRKGTETLVVQVLPIKNCFSFQSITPQGDGN